MSSTRGVGAVHQPPDDLIHELVLDRSDGRDLVVVHVHPSRLVKDCPPIHRG
ncbi:hypothetical protein [Streptomyces sp. 11x1]|uniref:hypothetical protein n=1 Tax=Streptomyces sp. 11x1 TaxID=3038642 RepID=UPI00292EFAC3|nr:hypothetical protein [Streptomyces sp. 11x1]WNZ06372.1 hypothetical protein P8T65_01330 [Streptomyces sp. 11x1]